MGHLRQRLIGMVDSSWSAFSFSTPDSGREAVWKMKWLLVFIMSFLIIPGTVASCTAKQENLTHAELNEVYDDAAGIVLVAAFVCFVSSGASARRPKRKKRGTPRKPELWTIPERDRQSVRRFKYDRETGEEIPIEDDTKCGN